MKILFFGQWNIKMYRNALQLSIRLGTLNTFSAHNAGNNLEMKVIYLFIILCYTKAETLFYNWHNYFPLLKMYKTTKTTLKTQKYKGFHERDGKPYCRKDYFDMFAPRCAGCNQAIMENYISALNSQFHPDCFVCRVSCMFFLLLLLLFPYRWHIN